MGMQLEAIRQLPPTSHEDRLFQQGNVLEGAHLPPRGFYYIKPARITQASKQRTSSLSQGKLALWIPFWHCQEKLPALRHPSADPELTESSVDEAAAAVDSQECEAP